MTVLSFLQAIFGTWLYTTGLKMWKAAGFPEPESYQIFLLAAGIFIVFTLLVIILKKLADWTVAAVRSFLGATGGEKLLVIAGLMVIIAIVVYIVSDLVVRGVL